MQPMLIMLQMFQGSVFTSNATAFWNDSVLYVGIGTAAPLTALDVNGSISATGSINTTNDIAVTGVNTFRNISNSLDIPDFLSTYNETYHKWAYNQTSDTFTLWNSTWDNRLLI